MTASSSLTLTNLLHDVRNCRHCEHSLSHGPRPIVRANASAKVLIIGQAPGTKVHHSGIPWDDPSGIRLRSWMGVDEQTFYDESQIAIIPMGFCYPGKGKSGDLPPRPECAPLWHERLLKQLPSIRCTLLIGQYAQNYYLQDNYKTLTERVRHWHDYAPRFFVLPHPSPRNQIWLKRNSWFEQELLPPLQHRIHQSLADRSQ